MLAWLICMGLFALPASADQTYWQHDPSAPGDWFEAINWTDGVPEASDSAFVDNGGTALIASGDADPDYECAGFQAAGAIRQTGGENTVVVLDIGLNAEADGTYELTSTGRLVADLQTVGAWGTGIIRQTGGTNTARALRLAYAADSNGTYELSGMGTLAVAGVTGGEYVGYRGTGKFTHTGGTHTLIGADLYVGYRGSGTYELSGAGWLSAAGEYVGYSAVGRFIQTGGANTAGDLYLGHDADGNGTYELGGTGQLSAVDESIGRWGVGRFVHTGGTNAAGMLRLGDDCDGNGAYELSGSGALSADWQYVGYLGAGSLVQTGGTNTIERELVVGHFSGGSGTYELREGQLSADVEHVGRGGAGRLAQAGGTNTVGSLYLGYTFSGDGTYELSGAGRLEADEERVGCEGTGAFIQTGGTNAVGGVLSIACEAGAAGTYELSGGELSAGEVHIGPRGRLDLTGGVFRTRRVEGDLVNDGATFVPDASLAATEIDGNYTQNAGRLAIGISGTGPGEYDVLSVSGNVVPGGVLDLETIGGFQPQYGDEFEIVQAGGSIAGVFDLIEGVELAPNMSLAVLYDANTIVAVATLPGDADVDGDVDRLDFLVLEDGFAREQADWSHGDFNGDGEVSFLDYLTWKRHAGGSIDAFAWSPPGGGAPEPLSSLLLAAGSVMLLARGRPRRVRALIARRGKRLRPSVASAGAP